MALDTAVLVPLLTTLPVNFWAYGSVGDVEKLRYRREMTARTGQLEQILPDNVLHEVAVLEIQRRGDLSRPSSSVSPGTLELTMPPMTMPAWPSVS